MKTLISLLFLSCAIMGCDTSAPPPAKIAPVKTVKPAVQVAPPPTGFTVSGPGMDESYPTYTITYTHQLTGQRSITITAISKPWLYPYGDGLYFNDELRQINGRYVAFDCDHIADRIIDINLVNEIKPYCKQGHMLGAAYWLKHNYVPDEYVDNMGHRWKRVK